MPLPVILTPLQLMSLAALVRRPQQAYGVRQEILEFYRQRNSNPPKSSVKRALSLLAQDGLIQDCQDGNYWVTKRRDSADIYELTETGRRRLESELIMYLEVIIAVKAEKQRQGINDRQVPPQGLIKIPLPQNWEDEAWLIGR